MAEWLRRGLQILARRFDSGSGLHSSVAAPLETRETKLDQLVRAHPRHSGALERLDVVSRNPVNAERDKVISRQVAIPECREGINEFRSDAVNGHGDNS